MPIDWFTVGAQALNFVVLVWLMKRFLYGPILQAIDAREQRIAAELADAAETQQRARQERDAFAGRNAAFEQQTAARLAQLEQDVADARQRLMQEARDAAVQWRDLRQSTLQAEAEQLDQVIREQAQAQVFAIAHSTLQDLAASSLEERICAVFVQRLQALDSATGRMLADGKTPLLVRSGFVLSDAMRATLQAALHSRFPSAPPARFERAPELICGIELVGAGHKLAWNIAGYLEAMQAHVGDLLRRQSQPAQQARDTTTGDTGR